jgi:magnesium chelatase subunit I
LVGSLNPEEGRLRPQILDRFGLRLIVPGLADPAERLEAYRRVRAFLLNPHATIAAYARATADARREIQAARAMLPSVVLNAEAERLGLALVRQLAIDSLRAEITLFEAARAYAAIDGRAEATAGDLRWVAPMALRLRRSPFMLDYFRAQQAEEQEIHRLLDEVPPG